MTSIVLFRNNLRLRDNYELFKAASCSSQILPVYCFDNRQVDIDYVYGRTKEPVKPKTYVGDFVKSGPFKTRFLVESVRDLSQSFLSSKQKYPMVVGAGRPEDLVCSLVQFLQSRGVNIRKVFVQKEISQEELEVEAALTSGLSNLKVPVELLWSSTLIHVDDLPFAVSDCPDNFTSFRKSVEYSRDISSKVRKLTDIPNLQHSLSNLLLEFQTLKKEFFPHVDGDFSYVPQTVANAEIDKRGFYLQGGESAGLARVQAYLEHNVHRYKETRNGLIGLDYSSKFSAYLSLGCVSPRDIYWQLQQLLNKDPAKYGEGCYWLTFELLWRDYFKLVAMKYGNQIFHTDGISLSQVEKQWQPVDKVKLKKFIDGQTGIPIIDAGMRELKQTGASSNRLRQNLASFFIHSLKMDWRLGACWFESSLVDYDTHSNYGNWMYLAGIGNDPRENRKFNVIKQAHDYDPAGEFAKLWCPELEEKGMDLFMPWKNGANWPMPIAIEPEWNKFAHNGKGKSKPNSGRKSKPRKTDWNIS